MLLALATWMNADGTNARPGQALLAEVTGLSDRTVRGHLAAAVEAGWLICTERGHGSRYGKATASCYRASVPTADGLDAAATTGDAIPVVTEDYRHPPAASGLQPAPQPAAERSTTGTGVPPTKQDHVDQERGPLLVAQRIVARHHHEIPSVLAPHLRSLGAPSLLDHLERWADDGTRFTFPSQLNQALREVAALVVHDTAQAAAQARIEATQALLSSTSHARPDCARCHGDQTYRDDNGYEHLCDHQVSAA